jgi:hypothetical protein
MTKNDFILQIFLSVSVIAAQPMRICSLTLRTLRVLARARHGHGHGEASQPPGEHQQDNGDLGERRAAWV